MQKTVIEKQKDMALILDIKKDLRFKEGINEGIEKGIEKVARNMHQKGYSLELINEATKFLLNI